MNVAILGGLAGKRSNWLSGYSYRKSFTYSRASGAVENYQVKILVGESSGATGEDVDCGGNCLSTFNDLRFTNSDGDLLDYWIESISGTTPNQLATVWVELDSVSTDATTFYMYYGNSGASAASSGANTFILFDDFERGSDGDTVGGDWTETVEHVHISTDTSYNGNRCAKIVGRAAAYPNADISITPSSKISVMIWVNKVDAGGASVYMGLGSSYPRYALVTWNTDEDLKYFKSTGSVDTEVNPAVDQWHKWEINNINTSDGKYDFWHNGTKYCNSQLGPVGSWYNGLFRIAGDSNAQGVGVDAYFDCFIVRNWRSVEPAPGSWGSEESA